MTPSFILIYNGWDDGGLNEELKKSFVRAFANLEDNSGVRLPNAPKSLENGDVVIKSHLKMLRFMDSMN